MLILITSSKVYYRFYLHAKLYKLKGSKNKIDMFIQTFETPNPSTLKFTAGMQIMKKGTAAYAKDDDLSDSPLAQKLFQIEHIQEYFSDQTLLPLLNLKNSNGKF